MRLAPLQHFLLIVTARQTGIYQAVDAANFDLVMKAFGRLVTTE